MLFCLQCCERCVVCLDRFAREDSASVATGAPVRCEWSQTGDVSLVDERVQLETGGRLQGPAGQRVEVTLRASVTGAIAEIALGEVTGVAIFGSPGYIVLTGGLEGFLLETCSLATGVDHTFFLCLGALESDPVQPAAQFGLVGDDDCVVGDLIATGSDRHLLLRTVTGQIEVDDVKVEHVQSEANPTCPECVPDPPDADCLVCRDNFNRANNSDVTVGQTCSWTDSGAAAIAGNRLSLPAGATLSGPNCDYVFFTAYATSDDAELTVMIGTVGVTVEFGAAESTMTIIAPGGGGTTTATLPHVTTGSSGGVFVLCIGKVDKRAGVLCFATGDPSKQVSGQMADNPTSPFGAVSFSSTGVVGTVEVDQVSLYRRRVDGNEHCTSCHPNLCAICSDFMPVFSTSDCGWTNAGGFGYLGSDWMAAGAFATAISGVGNPDNRPIMVLSATWEWTSAIESDTVRLRVASNGAVGPYIEITNSGYYNGAGCIKLYSSTNVLLSTVSNPGGSTVGVLRSDGYGVWLDGEPTHGDLLGRNNIVLPGNKATIGTGASFDGSSYVTFGLMALDWYAANPWHKLCASSLRTCLIFRVGFPTAGGGFGDGSDAGDPATEVNCHIDYSAGDWTADFIGTGSWGTQANDARITILTNHPDAGVGSFTGYIVWAAQANADPAEYNFTDLNTKYPGVQVLFDYGGASIIAEHVGTTAGSARTLYFAEITMAGVPALGVSTGAGGLAPAIFGGWACFGRTRTLLGFTEFGARQGGVAPTGGVGVGVQAGPTLFGVGDSALTVSGISLSHTAATAPQNGFSGEAADCMDCDADVCVYCDEGPPPASITLNIAPKAGADTSNLCAADLAVLNNSYVLQNTGGGCKYTYYLGPAAKENVQDYCEEIWSFVDPDLPEICGHFIGIRATITDGGLLTVHFLAVTGGVHVDGSGRLFGDVYYSGAIPGGDCTDFAITLAGEHVLLGDLFDVSVESN